ncbi:MAG TPA: hypothetical protein VFC25_00265 [Verrucomicrobiae bacterium]|nr:hypothetical protein [Verrucomicrobiae bacterium]
MARIVWKEAAQATGTSHGSPQGAPGPVIEIHYQSPHEFVKDLTPANSPERIFVQTERALPPGARPMLHLHIGFVARVIRLNARVETVTTPFESRTSGAPAGMSLSLLGPDGAASPELRELVQQLQQGLATQAATGSVETTESRMRKDRQLLTMPTTLKLMHAIKADLEDRRVLANDVDPRSIEFLLKNPGITMAEIRALAGRPTLTTPHIQTILANRAWSADEQVRMNLARNPRLPDMFVESVLESLSVMQLKVVAGSSTTTSKAKRLVHRMLEAKGH